MLPYCPSNLSTTHGLNDWILTRSSKWSIHCISHHALPRISLLSESLKGRTIPSYAKNIITSKIFRPMSGRICCNFLHVIMRRPPRKLKLSTCYFLTVKFSPQTVQCVYSVWNSSKFSNVRHAFHNIFWQMFYHQRRQKNTLDLKEILSLSEVGDEDENVFLRCWLFRRRNCWE